MRERLRLLDELHDTNGRSLLVLLRGEPHAGSKHVLIGAHAAVHFPEQHSTIAIIHAICVDNRTPVAEFHIVLQAASVFFGGRPTGRFAATSGAGFSDIFSPGAAMNSFTFE